MSEPLHVLKLEEAIITWHESGNTNFYLAGKYAFYVDRSIYNFEGDANTCNVPQY